MGQLFSFFSSLQLAQKREQVRYQCQRNGKTAQKIGSVVASLSN
jgi:hypothetical protein